MVMMENIQCDSRDAYEARRTLTLAIAAILFASILVKLGFIWYLDDRAYYDVLKALNYGCLVHKKIFSIHTDLINSKTFLGPVLWFPLYQSLGMLGLKLFNLLVFVLLFCTQYALGKGRYSARAIIIALFLVAFYVGTNRNVAAGEPDDNIAALLFSLGVLTYLNTKRPFVSSLLMGVGFLFKFWVAIFCVGFVVALRMTKRWRELWPAGVGMALPFLLINCIDGFASLHSLLMSEARQRGGHAAWSKVGFKMLSSGMIIAAVISAWTWLKQRNEHTTLFFFIPVAYVPYVLITKDPYAASFVMMLCLVFFSFLIAEFLLHAYDRWVTYWCSSVLIIFFASYLLLTSGITYLHLYRDTKPILLSALCAGVSKENGQ